MGCSKRNAGRGAKTKCFTKISVRNVLRGIGDFCNSCSQSLRTLRVDRCRKLKTTGCKIRITYTLVFQIIGQKCPDINTKPLKV